MQRQIESDPHAAAAMHHGGASQAKLSEKPTSAAGDLHQASAGSHHEGADASAEDGANKKKRLPIDKQTAFVEYKTLTDEGKSLEGAILQYREEVKEKKSVVKMLTMNINATKIEMDKVQVRL